MQISDIGGIGCVTHDCNRQKEWGLELETKPAPFLFCMLFSWMSRLNNLVFFFDQRVPDAPTSHLFVLYWIFWEDL